MVLLAARGPQGEPGFGEVVRGERDCRRGDASGSKAKLGAGGGGGDGVCDWLVVVKALIGVKEAEAVFMY